MQVQSIDRYAQTIPFEKKKRFIHLMGLDNFANRSAWYNKTVYCRSFSYKTMVL